MVEIELPIHSIMPIAVDHDQRRRLITAAVTGQLTADELFEFMTTRWGTARADHGVLFDARDMIVDQTATDVRVLVSRLEPHQASLRAPFAMVVAAHLAFGMARMYQTLLDGVGISRARVFWTTSEAELWLWTETH
jgi:hypothetical protein